MKKSNSDGMTQLTTEENGQGKKGETRNGKR